MSSSFDAFFAYLTPSKLWDITGDQGAIDLIRNIQDAQEASHVLVQHALSKQTYDNVTVLVIRFKHNTPQASG